MAQVEYSDVQSINNLKQKCVFKQFSKVDNISGNILTLDDKGYNLSNDNNTKIRKKCCSCQRHR